MRRLPGRVTLIFDGTCNFCTLSVLLLAQIDRHHRLTVIPFQAQHRLRQVPIAPAEMATAAWAVTPRGHRYRGAAAAAIAVAVALGTRWPMWVYQLPGIRQASDAIYAFVASHRHLIRGVTPYCERFPRECDPGSTDPNASSPSGG